MRLRLRSLQAQLAIRLAAVILVATALGVGAIVYEGMNAADALGNEQSGAPRGGDRAIRRGRFRRDAASGAAGQTRPNSIARRRAPRSLPCRPATVG